MTTAYEALNPALEVEIAGKTWKLRRVPVAVLLAEASSAVLSQRIRAIRESSVGLNPVEYGKFLADAFGVLPTGAALEIEAEKWLRSYCGACRVLALALRQDQSVSDTEAAALMDRLAPAEQVAFVRLVLATPVPTPPGGTEGPPDSTAAFERAVAEAAKSGQPVTLVDVLRKIGV
jgi:hypothetical protein